MVATRTTALMLVMSLLAAGPAVAVVFAGVGYYNPIGVVNNAYAQETSIEEIKIDIFNKALTAIEEITELPSIEASPILDEIRTPDEPETPETVSFSTFCCVNGDCTEVDLLTICVDSVKVVCVEDQEGMVSRCDPV